MKSWHHYVVKCLWFRQIFSAEILDWIKVGQKTIVILYHILRQHTHINIVRRINIMWLQNTNFNWLLSANNITKIFLGVRYLRYGNSEIELQSCNFFCYKGEFFPNVFWIYLEIVRTYFFVSNSVICRRYNSSRQWRHYHCQYSSTIQCT